MQNAIKFCFIEDLSKLAINISAEIKYNIKNSNKKTVYAYVAN